MDYDERSIRVFLRSYPGQFVSARVISRRLGGKRRFHDDPLWVMPFLNRLMDKGLVETDDQGHYRLKRVDRLDGSKRTWVSPQVKRILDRSARDFGKVITLDEEDEDLI